VSRARRSGPRLGVADPVVGEGRSVDVATTSASHLLIGGSEVRRDERMLSTVHLRSSSDAAFTDQW
jgi:hypothetical protein